MYGCLRVGLDADLVLEAFLSNAVRDPARWYAKYLTPGRLSFRGPLHYKCILLDLGRTPHGADRKVHFVLVCIPELEGSSTNSGVVVQL